MNPHKKFVHPKSQLISHLENVFLGFNLYLLAQFLLPLHPLLLFWLISGSNINRIEQELDSFKSVDFRNNLEIQMIL